MPARRVWYADTEGNVGFQDAALVPARRGGEWGRWMELDQLPHALNPRKPEASRLPDSSGQIASTATFAHVLDMTAAARQRFTIGPVPRPPDDSQVAITADLSAWDRSQAMNAPGQSGSPASPHFKDHVQLWSAGGRFPLAFSDAAVQANAASTLTLVPK
jgi:acyl-homoserine lactone acylase PvdQ